MASKNPPGLPLADRTCRRLFSRDDLLAPPELEIGLARLSAGWRIDEDDGPLVKEFEFGDYCDTMTFVNAVAWIAQRQDHHPELEVTYGRCRVSYSTHSAGGVTENDLICAAKIDRLPD